jgi:hypothetical protein
MNTDISGFGFVVLPHPNPPLAKERELDFLVSPLAKGGDLNTLLGKTYLSTDEHR